jgi:hypothetical protein
MPPHVQRAIERTKKLKAATSAAAPAAPTPSTPMVVRVDDGAEEAQLPLGSHQMLPALPGPSGRRPAEPPNRFSRIVSSSVRQELLRRGQVLPWVTLS